MATESKTAIIAAIVGNVAIAVTKFIAAAFTGSSAMLSEAIHSLVDTGNGALMLLGVHKSRKPPDEEHPFGHGRELYFWTLIVAILVFSVGGGMSIYEGTLHVSQPTPPENLLWSYAVLAFAFVFEGISWLFGWKAFAKERGKRGVFRTIHETKDPTTFAVVLEDSAALTGLVIAFLGIFLADQLDVPILDGVASIIIGVLLCGVAALMLYETKGLLIGEGVDRKTLEDLRAIVSTDKDVELVKHLHTIYESADTVLMIIELRFKASLNTLGVREAIRRLQEHIQAKYPHIKYIFFGTATLTSDDGKESSDTVSKQEESNERVVVR